MARGSTISISLTPRQLRAVKSCVTAGGYESVSAVVRDSLRKFFGNAAPTESPANDTALLARAYKSTAKRDRAIAQAWAQLDDAWPEK